MKMTTPIPPEITTPDVVETRLGTLRFFDGYPDPDTIDKLYDNLDFQRGALVDGDPKPAAEQSKALFRMYRLGEEASAPAMLFVNASGQQMNTIHANDFHFFEEIAPIIDEEPVTAMDVETMGLLAAIGLEKGQPFAPDASMKAILSEAAAVGNATARAIMYANRAKNAFLYPDSAWHNPVLGEPDADYMLIRNGGRMLDVRTYYFYFATIHTPAMLMKMIGAGSHYIMASKDAHGERFDGGRTYRLHLPPNIPAKNFWSVVVYDNQTRSLLQTDQRYPSCGSQKPGILINPDTSVDIYFGPEAPQGMENNWVQTIPGKGWHLILRLYGPLEAFFDKTWRPGEFEPLD